MGKQAPSWQTGNKNGPDVSATWQKINPRHFSGEQNTIHHNSTPPQVCVYFILYVSKHEHAVEKRPSHFYISANLIRAVNIGSCLF